MNFQPYPFERLKKLTQNIIPKKDIISLSIGEPQFETPLFIQEELKHYSHELRYYPKSSSEEYLKNSQLSFIKKHFNLNLESCEIIPTFGTREVLFNLPQFLLFNKPNPVIAHPNPFYQIYEGACIACKAKSIYMNLDKNNDFKPSLSKEDRKQVNLVILNSPNNPTGSTLTLDELKKWVEWSLEYDFILLNDECYNQIYQNTPAKSILEASYALGNTNFKNVLCLNSISKRSCAPSLRSGFIAGDREILKDYALYRSYLGCAIPNPLQRASAKAWEDDECAEKTRKKYAKNLKIAKDLFSFATIHPYTFYIWLEVGNDELFTKKLYEEEGILVLPGTFLSRESQGAGYVRIALVYEPEILKNILERLAKFYHSFKGE